MRCDRENGLAARQLSTGSDRARQASRDDASGLCRPDRAPVSRDLRDGDCSRGRGGGGGEEIDGISS